MEPLSSKEKHSHVENLLRDRNLDVANQMIESYSINLKSSIECSNVFLTVLFLFRLKKKKRSYLKRACEIGNLEIVYVLIDFGYSLNEASIYSCGQLVKDLIERGACPIYKNCKALQNAVLKKDLDLVDYLLDNRADIKPGIDTALEKAIRIKDEKIIHTLLRSFADVSPKTLSEVEDENIRQLLNKYIIT